METKIAGFNEVGVWLINLERDTSRLEKMKTQLSKLGLDFFLFQAIDGNARLTELKGRVNAKAYARNMGSNVLPGKMGCYASHVAVWEAFLASQYQIALILEDDVVFHDDFLESLAIGLVAKTHWDTLRFNAIRAKIPVSQGKIGGYHLNAYLGPFTGNATYLIHRDVAARLIPSLWPQTRAFDHELNRFFIHDFRQLGLEPFSSHVDDGNVSSITGIGFAEVRKFKRYRRLWHYGLKAINYLRRGLWLLTSGRLWPSNKQLLNFSHEPEKSD